ncbi:MAG: carboxypeptidase-like regulatory domain-containing protein [Thermoplasmatota archaeon]
MKAPLLVAALAMATLAGCAQQGSDVPHGAVAPTATTGTVRGLVVDAGIHPLAGAAVTLRVADHSTVANTSADGLFRFDGVPAGSHVLRVHRTGYLAVQLPVQIEPGVAEPGLVRVALDPDPAYRKPFLQPFKFSGLMECSAVVDAPAPVGRAAVAACALPGQTVGVSPTQDSFIAIHVLDSGRPDFVQSELVWTPSGPLADTLLLHMDQRNHSAGPPTVGAEGAQAGYTELASASGPSPLIVGVEGAGVNRLGLGNDLQLRVFAWFEEPVPVGVVVEQSFDLYSTVFYGFRPPMGWSIADGLPTVPDA